MKKLIIIDNEIIYKMVRRFIDGKNRNDIIFCHSGKLIEISNESFFKSKDSTIDVMAELEFIKENYDLIISIHCQQIFPRELVKKVRCINLHPGYNPSTRGWYPHVFAIIYDLPAGATLHEMDEFIDHGPIIARKPVEKDISDTSCSLYNKILKAEVELITENFDSILDNSYRTQKVDEEDNLFSKSDYGKLLEIDLNREGKFIDFYNMLRALSHRGHKNAFFYLPASGKKIFLSMEINVEDQ
ncbi:MAG: dTDP-4-amino-4,6-dideoxyglucose formyltransferase [Ignavibacteriaceae bacterium]